MILGLRFEGDVGGKPDCVVGENISSFGAIEGSKESVEIVRGFLVDLEEDFGGRKSELVSAEISMLRFILLLLED